MTAVSVIVWILWIVWCRHILGLIDMPFFAVCIVTIIQGLISAFSIQTDPVQNIDVSCVGKCYLLFRKDFARWSQSVSQSVRLSISQSANQSVNQPISQPTNQSISPSVCQSVLPSVSQTNSQSFSQSVSPSVS